MCLKKKKNKQVPAQVPDVGELGLVAHGLVSAKLLQVTMRQREMMICFSELLLGRKPGGGSRVSLSLEKLNLGTPKRISLNSEKIGLRACRQGENF